ncbi:MAG TPA: DinB family protein [Mycobacteriales bacterium]|nr:DinB family protein [Mycobacteriales bacterium]
MSWIAPPVELVDEPFTADERTTLEGWLEAHHSQFLDKCAGLTPQQLAQRSVPPSPLSLLGLIRHLTDVERTWIRRRLAGEPIDPAYPGKDSCFTEARPETAESDYAALLAEWEECHRAVRDIDLEQTFLHQKYGPMSLRWLYGHLIREYAGHCGHADLLRERIDGATFS